ncbi:MAG: peptide chain release factor 3 [Actinomycetota bacterium]
MQTTTVSSVAHAAQQRRTFAIISHPDAGKTTLTEKFLLYSGAIAEAGVVRARREGRAVVSDWMDLERQRGISITSTVLRFDHQGVHLNLLDTPGHRDFSEDTYRVLTAVDAAIMVLDAAKGIESQTRKLFEVCRLRGIPLLTFINKYDRPGMEALRLLDEIEQTLALHAAPVVWPVGIAGDLRGVLDRRDGSYHRFGRTAHGARQAPEEHLDAARAAAEDGDAWHRAEEETALLNAIGADLDRDEFLSGRSTPVFFGSALTNFGVRLLLDAIVELAPAPSARPTLEDGARHIDAPFSGFVFKVQANMDPNHRDRIAFVRVCSGRFQRGMTATIARTGRPFALKYAHQVRGRDRETLDEAYPGDIIGLVNATELSLGDTLYVDRPVSFPPIPTFAPEHFAVARNRDTSRYKQFRRGLAALDEEGVIQVLRHPDRGDQAPVLAAVGPMQFEVAAHRLAQEFGARVDLSPLDYTIARLTDAAGEPLLRLWREAEVLHRANGARYALFRSQFWLERFQKDHPDVWLETVFVDHSGTHSANG